MNGEGQLKDLTSKVKHLEDMIEDNTESKTEYQEAIINKSAEKETLENNVEEMKQENAKLTGQIGTLTAGNKNLARDIQVLQEELESTTKNLSDNLKESKASAEIRGENLFQLTYPRLTLETFCVIF